MILCDTFASHRRLSLGKGPADDGAASSGGSLADPEKLVTAIGRLWAPASSDFPSLFRMGGLCHEPYTPLPLTQWEGRTGGSWRRVPNQRLGGACGSHARATGKRAKH